jgi:hypothetical protein
VCIDDASRLAYSEILANERKDSAIGGCRAPTCARRGAGGSGDRAALALSRRGVPVVCSSMSLPLIQGSGMATTESWSYLQQCKIAHQRCMAKR